MSCSSQSRDVILIRSYETRPPGLHFFFRFSFMLFTFLTSSRNVDLILFFNFFHNLVVFGSFCFFIEPTCCVPASVISTAKRCVHWPLRTLSNWCIISFPWLKLREPISIYRTFTSTTGAEVLVKEGQEWHQQQKLLVWKQWLLGVGVVSCEPSVWALKSLLCILQEGAFKWNGH